MAKRGNASTSQKIAAYMKANKIERTTGKCPWGCGHSISNGGPALLMHLLKCRGKTRTYKI